MTEEERAMIEWLESASEEDIRKEMEAVEKELFGAKL